MALQRAAEENAKNANSRQAQSNRANRELAAATPQAGEAGRIADQESTIPSSGLYGQGDLTDGVLSQQHVQMVKTVQADIRNVLKDLRPGLASEATALLAAIDSDLTSEGPSSATLQKHLAAIEELLRKSSAEGDVSSGAAVKKVVTTLGSLMRQ